MTPNTFFIASNGECSFIATPHNEKVTSDLGCIVLRRRVSHIEVGAEIVTKKQVCLEDNLYYVDLSPVDGPLLGPFSLRSDAQKAEYNWLVEHGPKLPSTPGVTIKSCHG